MDIREAYEKEVQNELAKAMSPQNIERAKQQRLRQGIELNQKKFHEMTQKGKFTGKDAVLYEKYISISLKAIDAAQNKINSMEPVIQKIRDRLVEAQKERKVVERLKEKRLVEYNYHIDREETKELDDMNQKLFGRYKDI